MLTKVVRLLEHLVRLQERQMAVNEDMTAAMLSIEQAVQDAVAKLGQPGPAFDDAAIESFAVRLNAAAAALEAAVNPPSP
jgi:hypothetical protein